MPIPSSPILAACVLLAFVAGLVRGYGGFGYSMTAVTGMSLVLEPVALVPAVILLEIAASGLLIVRVWRQVDWKALGRLSAGMIVTTPAGAFLLATVPAAPMTIAIAVAVMALAAMMRMGFALKRRPGAAATVGVGMLSGLLNGGGAIGGPPVVLFFFSSPAGAAISRASLIAYFLGTDLIAAGVLTGMGVMTREALRLAAVMLIPTTAGVLCGARMFQNASEQNFRRRVLSVLIVLSAVAVIKATVTAH
ncbi:MAG: sulfite exporter TauE/SafE family protein [Pseudomonadota bacterium]